MKRWIHAATINTKSFTSIKASFEDDPRSDSEILQEAEYNEGLLGIEEKVIDELGLYMDFSAVRGDYGPIWIFSDPEHENDADMWMGDLNEALCKLDYSDFAFGVVTEVISYPKEEWKERFKNYILGLIG